MSRIALFDEYLYSVRNIIAHTFSFWYILSPRLSLSLSLSHKIYLEIRHSFLNFTGPLLPSAYKATKSHLYIFIRNLFTRVLTILLTISHANSNDPSSSASCYWLDISSDRFELQTLRERHDYSHTDSFNSLILQPIVEELQYVASTTLSWSIYEILRRLS